MHNAEQVALSGESDWGEDNESAVSFPSSISAPSEELSEELLKELPARDPSINTPTRRKAKSAAADRIKRRLMDSTTLDDIF
jgi:hypothetical protein